MGNFNWKNWDPHLLRTNQQHLVGLLSYLQCCFHLCDPGILWKTITLSLYYKVNCNCNTVHRPFELKVFGKRQQYPFLFRMPECAHNLKKYGKIMECSNVSTFGQQAQIYLQSIKKFLMSANSWLDRLMMISVKETSSVPDRAIVSCSSIERNLIIPWVSITASVWKLPFKSDSRSLLKL